MTQVINKQPDYAMFTAEGNAAVHGIVVAARLSKMSWSQVYSSLVQLSREETFGEATDTAVREMVYDALKFYEAGESFYV
jgi:hypothetical protein